MTDEACKAYGSLPDRLYIVHEGKIAYQGGLGPFEYEVKYERARNSSGQLWYKNSCLSLSLSTYVHFIL